MTEREALKLALEALEEAADAIDSWGSYASGYFQVKHDLEGDISKAKSAITAIKEALAQPEPWEKFCDSSCVWTDHHPDCKLAEQKPVAWTVSGLVRDWNKDFSAYRTQHYVRPVFTTPPQRKPLSDEEIKMMIPDGDEWKYGVGFSEAISFARAIEAAHGIYAPKERKGEA